jgi:uncharacterized protein (TIGR02757 family)
VTSSRLTTREQTLRRSLEALRAAYGPEHLDSDPVLFLHRYDDPRDVEVAGFIAASLAYGRVSLIRRSLEQVLGFMGPSPARFVTGFDASNPPRSMGGFVHRFTKGNDLSALFAILGRMIEDAGSIEAFMSDGNSRSSGPSAGGSPRRRTASRPARDPVGSTAGAGTDRDGIGGMLKRFSRRALSIRVPVYREDGTIPAGAGVRFFFPSPSGGSACKRLCLFLRWMVRGPDGVDLGVWRNLSPSSLVVPVDTHMNRIARFLGITRRRDASWKTAQELTGALRRLDPEDPVKYDFAITRLGILGLCRAGEADFRCQACGLAAHCIRGVDSSDGRIAGRT